MKVHIINTPLHHHVITSNAISQFCSVAISHYVGIYHPNDFYYFIVCNNISIVNSDNRRKTKNRKTKTRRKKMNYGFKKSLQ